MFMSKYFDDTVIIALIIYEPWLTGKDKRLRNIKTSNTL